MCYTDTLQFCTFILILLLLDVTAGDKAASVRKPQSKSQLCDSGYMQSGSESLLKAIKVGCLY